MVRLMVKGGELVKRKKRKEAEQELRFRLREKAQNESMCSSDLSGSTAAYRPLKSIQASEK